MTEDTAGQFVGDFMVGALTLSVLGIAGIVLYKAPIALLFAIGSVAALILFVMLSAGVGRALRTILGAVK